MNHILSEKRLHPENLSPSAENHAGGVWKIAAVLAGTAALVAACMLLPEFLLKRQDVYRMDKVQTSSQVYSAGDLESYVNYDSFYNRLMLITGLWECTADLETADYSYQNVAAQSTIQKLTVGMRDSDGNWHENGSILRSGNAIQAVCNLTEFELMPEEWNFYYNDWSLSDIQGILFKDTVVEKYSCILYCFLFQDDESDYQTSVYVDDETGNFVGFSVTYDEDEMKLLLEEETENDKLSDSHSSAESSELFYDQYLESQAVGTAVISDEESSDTKKENTTSVLGQSIIRSMLNLPTSAGAARDQEQAALLTNASSFLSKLGFCDITEITDENEKKAVEPAYGMKTQSGSSFVFRCTEFSSGSQFYFVVQAGEGWFEAYFSPYTGNFNEKALTEETPLE